MSCRLFRHERQSGMIPPAPCRKQPPNCDNVRDGLHLRILATNGSLARPTPPGRCAGKSKYPPTQDRSLTIDEVRGLQMDRTSLVSADHSF